ncbi:hypothetical protein Tco_0491083 [Tanacetum coccineum]
MNNGREMTPPPGFSTPPQMLNINTSERPPVTTTVFAATTLENTSFAYRASTSANPNPMIRPGFVEANYEREMEPKDLRAQLGNILTPSVRRSLGARRLRERVRRCSKKLQKGRRWAGKEMLRRFWPLEIKARENGKRGMNLPLLLAAHLGRNESDQPLQSSLTSVYKGHQPSTNIGEISLLTAQNGSAWKTSKDQRSPPGTITEDRKVGIGSPPTEDLLPSLFKSPREILATKKGIFKAPDRRSCNIRAASPFGKRNKEGKGEDVDTRWRGKIGGKDAHVVSKPPSHGKQDKSHPRKMTRLDLETPSRLVTLEQNSRERRRFTVTLFLEAEAIYLVSPDIFEDSPCRLLRGAVLALRRSTFRSMIG